MPKQTTIPRTAIRNEIKRFRTLAKHYRQPITDETPTELAWAEGKADAYDYAADYLVNMIKQHDTLATTKEQP